MQPTQSPKAIFQARHLACIRGNRRLFHRVSFALEQGEVLQIVGPNGSGKSTLIQVLCGLMCIDRGRLYWKNQCLTDCKSEFLNNMIYLGHQAGLKDNLTPTENLQMICALKGNVNKAHILTALQHVGLEGFENVLVQQLSAGQKRRAALAVLALQPASIWFLDEPLTALDEFGVKIIEQLLVKHIQQGGVAIISSHQSINLTTITMKQLCLT